jgi:hypothetical protein
MPPNLVRYLNKTVLVSIPVLFDDGTARPYTLLGAEMNGLWLQSEELTNRLLRDDCAGLAEMDPAVFVPFAQIAGVLIPTSMPPAAEQAETSRRNPPKRAKSR